MKTFPTFFLTALLCVFCLQRSFAQSSCSASIQVLSHHTSCTSPANGSLKAIVSGSASNYLFRWYQGTTNTGPVLTMNQTINHLTAGTYTVSVTHKTTQCQSIASATVLPEVSLAQLSPNTACSAEMPNGSLAAVVQGVPSNYTYRWFAGSDTWSAPPISTTQNLTGVYGGVYTLLVFNTLTFCQYIISATVADEVPAPDVLLTVSNVTSCVAPNGSLTAEIAGESASDYAFSWYEGTDINTGLIISWDQTVTGLQAGTYTVVVTHGFTGCHTIVSAVITDETVSPNISVQVWNNTSCGVPNGQVVVFINGLHQPIGYTYEWFEGMGISGPIVRTSYIASYLPAGIYTVRVTNNSSGCSSIMSTMIMEDVVNPQVSVDVVNSTSCTMPNGSLTANVNGSVSDYGFVWFKGTYYPSAIFVSNDQTITDLSAGGYMVLVTHIQSGCQTLIYAAIDDECESASGRSSASKLGNISTRQEVAATAVAYPNPTNGMLSITPEAGADEIVLMDSKGKIVRRHQPETSSEKVSVDLTDQPQGIYILKITSGINTSTHRIVKE